MTLYPEAQKTRLLERMLPPQAVPVLPRSQETGIPKDPLYGWRRQACRARGLPLMGSTNPQERWSSAEKFARVVQTTALNEAQRGDYCRQRGLYPEQLQCWRQRCEHAHGGQTAQRAPTDTRPDPRRVRERERARRRKDKALAETAALVVLRKKADASLAHGRGRMSSPSDRQQAVELLQEARRPGARVHPAWAERGIDPRTYQRWTRGEPIKPDGRPEALRPVPANNLSVEERAAVLAVCHEPPYASLPPGQIVPRLADEDPYSASDASFYRSLRQAEQQHPRGRARAPRPAADPPRLCAQAPCQGWTWDSSWLSGAVTGLVFYLYLMVDLYSRKIVGWEIYERECAGHAAEVVRRAVLAEHCLDKPLSLQADNGSPLKGETLREPLYRLGIATSYSRPGTSNDNPYSEALFRTCTYCPAYPAQGVVDLEAARTWMQRFGQGYHQEQPPQQYPVCDP